jgi:hypothetical protein
MNLRRFCALNDTEILELAARAMLRRQKDSNMAARLMDVAYPLRDFRHSSQPGNVRRNTLACSAQMGTQRLVQGSALRRQPFFRTGGWGSPQDLRTVAHGYCGKSQT